MERSREEVAAGDKATADRKEQAAAGGKVAADRKTDKGLETVSQKVRDGSQTDRVRFRASDRERVRSVFRMLQSGRRAA